MTLHLATSYAFGGVVARAIHAPVCFITENLLLGPCASDPEEHAQLRSDFWDLHGRELTRFRASFRALREAIHSRERVVIWTTRCLADTAALWWLCAWRLLRWPLQPDLDLVVLGPDPGPVTGLDRINLRVRGADVRQGLDDVRPLSLARVRSMARGWRKLTGRAPVSDPEGIRVEQDRRDLLDLVTYQAGFFPRLEARGLVLSRFDALLFSCLGGDWLTPAEVFVHDSAAGEELRKWAYHIGDVLVGTRMAQWAEHRGTEAALESKPWRPERGVLLAARYRVSRVGQAIRRQGLREIAEGPSLAVFGAVAYDPLAPWVVVDEQAGRPSFRLRK